MSLDIPVSTITGSTAGTSSTTSTASKELDKDTFLKLLVAQLSNQDPSSPMDTSDMMAQTTQLSMMESLSALQSAASEQFALQMRMASADLVGKQRLAEPLGPLRGWGLEGARSPTPADVVVPEEVGAPPWWTAPSSAGSRREA